MVLFEAVTWWFGGGVVFVLTIIFWVMNMYGKQRARAHMIQDKAVLSWPSMHVCFQGTVDYSIHRVNLAAFIVLRLIFGFFLGASDRNIYRNIYFPS